METKMKCFLGAIVLAAYWVTGLTAEARAHKLKAPINRDRLMYANPGASSSGSPVFRWNGRSSWGELGADDRSWSNDANGS